MCVLLINMTPIEFFEMPEESEIELEFPKRKFERYRCRTGGNVVLEVFDDHDEIIATSLENLKAMGAVKVTIVQKHEVEI